MFKFYKFIFFSIYRFFISINKKDIPESKAVLVFSLWIIFYFGSIIPLINYSIPGLYIPKWITGSFYIFICLSHFFFLFRKKEYLKLYRAFMRDEEYRNRYKYLIPVFFIFPFVMLIVYAFTIWR